MRVVALRSDCYSGDLNPTYGRRIRFRLGRYHPRVATETTPRPFADGSTSGRADASAEEAVGSLLLPIGHYVGRQHGGGHTQAERQVRRGATFHDLSDDQYAVWALAHGTPQAIQNEVTWHRGLVEEQARASGLADPALVIDELLERGLLVDLASADGQALEFATRHRLVPLMLGLGNVPGEPDLFGIGFLHQPIVQVSHAIYDVWQWSTMDDSLWATCESAADVARRSGSTAPEFTDPTMLLAGMLGALHTLLLTNAAILDIGFRLNWPNGSSPSAVGGSAERDGSDD
jgi:hypothetical protein